MRRYELGDLIGTGGSGAVYRALDRLTGHWVAMKRIERVRGVDVSAATESSVLQSLAREFQILAGMRHPYIVNVLDYGFDADRRPYFTMELLDNAPTIVEAAHALPHAERLGLLGQLFQALAYLHRRGVLHRDLKPANVLVHNGTVRVLDFGLASFGPSLNTFAGTAHYMPPEMLLENRFSTVSDLYSVGVLAVEILTGHQPFVSGDVLAMLHQPPDLTGLDDPALRAFITRLLHKDPSHRPTSAENALKELARAGQISLVEKPTIRESYLQVAPFTGREAELARLTEALDAVQTGQGEAVLLGGESGIGKSRLLAELRVRALAAGAHVYNGQALPTGGQPEHLWRDVIAHLIVDSDPEHMSDQEAGILKTIVPEIDRYIGRNVQPAPALSANETAQRLAYAIVTLIERLNTHTQRPVVLLLEDLQWIDKNLDVLRSVNRAAAHLPLLIVGSYRSDEATDLPEQLPTMTPLPLTRFSLETTQQLCMAMIGTTAGADLVERLHRETEGNPFFLVEMVRALSEQAGQLAKISADNLPETLFPAGVAHLIQRRLDLVPDWARPLLNLAAVAGRQIDVDLLVRAAETPIDPIDMVDMDDWLYTCAAASVLENYDNQWRFSHDKLREALLFAQRDDHRAENHRRVASAIEELHGEDPAYAAVLTEHWQEAGDVDRALDFVLKACDYFNTIDASAQLRRYSERGLALLRPIDDVQLRLRLLHHLGRGYARQNLEAAVETYQTALRLSEQHRSQEETAHLSVGLAFVYVDMGRLSEAEALINKAIDYATTSAQHALHHLALDAQTQLHQHRGEYPQAIATRKQALIISQARDDARAIAEDLMSIAQMHFIMNQDEAALPHLERAMQIAQDANINTITAIGHAFLGTAAGRRGDLDTAISHLEKGAEFFTSVGQYRSLASAYHNLGTAALRLSNIDEARRWHQKQHRLAQLLGDATIVSEALGGLGSAEYEAGNFSMARDYLQAALVHSETSGSSYNIFTWNRQLILTYAYLGEYEPAQQALAAMLNQAATLGAVYFQVRCLSAAIQLASMREDWPLMAEWYGLARQHAADDHEMQQELDTYLTTLQDQLDADELAAVVERGQALNLKTTLDTLRADIDTASTDRQEQSG